MMVVILNWNWKGFQVIRHVYNERTGDFYEVEVKVWHLILKWLLLGVFMVATIGVLYAWSVGYNVSDFCELMKCWWGGASVKMGEWFLSIRSYVSPRSVVGVACLIFLFVIRRLLVSGFKIVAGILFYPVIKWWGGVKNAWAEKDWLLLLVFALLGLFLYWGYIFLIGFGMLSFQDIRLENISGVLVWAFFITVVVLYFKALGLAKTGELVVYCNWSDFLKSSVWVYAVPIGLVFIADDSADWFHHSLGWIFIIAGICSFVCLVRGAFVHNTGSLRWLSLFSRFAVVFLALAAISELHSRIERFKKGELGVIRGVLLPLMVFALIFNTLVKPMIGTSRWRSWSDN